MKEENDAGTLRFRRGNGIGMQRRTSDATREVSPVEGFAFQLGSREGQARPVEMAERLVVPKKPGNSGGWEGALVQGQRRKQQGTGTLAKA